MLSSKAKMWVPVKRSAEDMFVDMGLGPNPAAASLDQGVQVQTPSTVFQRRHSPYFAFNSFLNQSNIPVVSTNLVTVYSLPLYQQ